MVIGITFIGTLVDTLPIKWTVHEGEYIYLDCKGNRTFY